MERHNAIEKGVWRLIPISIRLYIQPSKIQIALVFDETQRNRAKLIRLPFKNNFTLN